MDEVDQRHRHIHPPRVDLAPTSDVAALDQAAPAASSNATTTKTGFNLPWVASTYFAEGLPYTIVHKVASEFFTAAGASLETIGLASAFHLPWNLKFLWSPLVDRFGTTRRWLLATELLLSLCVLGMGWLVQGHSYTLVAAGFVLMATFAATHDIAVDGYYLKALEKKEQTAFTGVRVAAYRVALLAGGVLVSLAGLTSFGFSFAVAGVVLALLTVTHAVILPRLQTSIQTASTATWSHTLARFKDAFLVYLRQPQIVTILAFILLYRAGDAMMFSMNSPLLKSLGLDTTARGNLAIASTVVSIGGSLLGGLVIAKKGLRQTIFPIALLQSLAIVLYVALAWFKPGLYGVVGIKLAEEFAAGVGTAALMVFLMRRCFEPHKAAHFAIGSALMSLAFTALGSISGYLAKELGFTVFFALSFVASIPGVILSRFVPAD